MHVVHLHGSRTRVSQRGGGGGGGNKPAGFKGLNLVKARPPRNQACLLSMEIVEPYPFGVGFGIIVPTLFRLSMPLRKRDEKESKNGDGKSWRAFQNAG